MHTAVQCTLVGSEPAGQAGVDGISASAVSTPPQQSTAESSGEQSRSLDVSIIARKLKPETTADCELLKLI